MRLFPLLRASLAVLLLPLGARAGVSPAEDALAQRRTDDAVRRLHQVLGAYPQHAYAHLLLCRVFLSKELPEQAVSECDVAAEYAPDNQEVQRCERGEDTVFRSPGSCLRRCRRTSTAAVSGRCEEVA